MQFIRKALCVLVAPLALSVGKHQYVIEKASDSGDRRPRHLSNKVRAPTSILPRISHLTHLNPDHTMVASSTPQTAKRKLRGTDEVEQPAASSSRSSLGGIGVGVGVGRVTRRSATAAAAASTPVASSSAQVEVVVPLSGRRSARVSKVQDSSAREDVAISGNQVEGGSAVGQRPNKRLKKSPTKRNSAIFNTASSTAPDRASISKSPQKSIALSPTKELDPQLFAFPRRVHLPYPIGLTPFRYPCLHPTIPAPPAGDPLNPKWKPYDPNHVSHLDPLPDSVRALSALGREPRMLRIGDDMGLGLGGRTAGGPSVSTSGQAAGGPSLPQVPLAPQPAGQLQRPSIAHVLDPELASLPHPPPPAQQPPEPASNSPSNPNNLIHPQLGTSDHILRPTIPGEGDPTFDINTFFESASYETISALLATGDHVGGESSGTGAG